MWAVLLRTRLSNWSFQVAGTRSESPAAGFFSYLQVLRAVCCQLKCPSLNVRRMVAGISVRGGSRTVPGARRHVFVFSGKSGSNNDVGLLSISPFSPSELPATSLLALFSDHIP